MEDKCMLPYDVRTNPISIRTTMKLLLGEATEILIQLDDMLPICNKHS